MSILKIRRRTAVRALGTAALAAALLGPAGAAVAADHGKTAPVASVSASAAKGKGKGSFAAATRTVKLADGTTGKITKRGDLHYSMQVFSGGHVVATLDANGKDTGVQSAQGMFAVLTADGQVRSWLGGAQYGPGTFKLVDGSTAKVTKVGDHYRMQIISEGYVIGTLQTNDDSWATGLLSGHGMAVVLTADGTFSSHIG
ncbi:hypothetical protein LRS74_19345 [Streptomyces sp. LX-29]|uniref:hypothetical protein n=1 Tax=Streptomyces sp. LX-29 TaxID=2900152 RepID=UPI00240D6549|nr:hypothetical protein [Streptomyces sp. LX-29]WFB08954.1 hypothetical protein LRS74_19345 [Streptomyces sp. LX-29]